LTVGINYLRTQNAVVSMGPRGFRVETESDPTVRVPDVVMRCVGFIGEAMHEDSSGISGDLCATGFFIAAPYDSPELANKRMAYFVTAAHVAKDLSDKPIYFLVNKRGGGVVGFRSVWTTEWWVHPTDRAADVCLIPVGQQPDADIKGVAIKDFVTAEDITSKRVGVGDETFITGLFTEAPGKSQNMPIVRHGNIAMLPEEQIQTDLGYADVYLVEARSIGGISGSPVFVRALDEGEESPARGSVRGMKLLGLAHGHWDIKESEINQASIVHDRKTGVNLGIGIVTPATKILDILNSEANKELRWAMEHKLTHSKSIPAMDSAKPRKENAEEQPLTREDFEAALKKVSRKKA